MTPQTALSNLFEGKEIRVIEQSGEVWIPIADIASAWGIDRSTPDKLIERNPEVFEGLSELVLDVTSNTTAVCLNERGLYLMMGKISAARLKNPAAKESIIRFQKWVPELIQKYRKKEIIPVLKEPDYIAALNAVKFAKELAGVVGTEILPLVCQALDSHGLGMYGGLLVVEKGKGPALPRLPKPKDYFTATDIGERIGKSPHEVNMFLYQRKPPLLIKDQKGEWRLTEPGKEYGEERIREVSLGSFVWRIRWKKDVLRLFNISGEHYEVG